MYRPTFLGKTSDFLQIVCLVILWMVPRAMGLGWFFPVPNNYTTTPEPFRPYPVLRPFVGLPAASATSTPRASRPKKSRASPYDYEELLDKSIMFYEAQRSGRLPFGRRVRWRKDSALRDRGLFGEDLTGGWYDAGDHVKFGLPMASATTVLLWGFIDYYDSYKDSGLEDAMFDCVKWPLDYFMKAHTKTFEFYAQVGDPKVDHTVWCRPEDLTMNRPSFRVTKTAPGSDVVGETAAALAAGAIAFNETDKYYSRRLLRHAEQLFQFADKYRGKYSDHVPAKDSYPSTDYKDELVWAALWLFKATGDKDYLEYAEKNYREGPAWAFCWDEKWAGAQILLYKFTRKRRYRTDIIRTLQAWQPGGSVKYTPKGLAIRYEWGPLRYASNMAFIALEAADAGIFRWWYRRWATKQIHYALGSTGKSFVVGYGEDPPQRPHHAASSCRPIPWPCSWDDYSNEGPNPIILYGALVGGPDINDRYTDNRTDYLHNEVTCDYNAGFQSSIAALRQIYKSDYS